MKSGEKVLLGLLMILFVAIDCYMLFHNLGMGYLIQTDEAWHATNAYEMYKQGNWVVNTYRGAADYFNSKPPLCLDLMIISYNIFGASAFAARFPSAIGGLITCMLVIGFFIRERKVVAAVIFPAIFGACSSLFTFHMYRAAEMDSVYNLFFTIAMISLYAMARKPQFMYAYGPALGLAFMCKGPHAALIFVIGLIYIPRIKTAFVSVKRVIISVILAVIVPFIWSLTRYMLDGTKLFEALLSGEVAGRVSGADRSAIEPWIDFLTSHIFVIFVVVLALAVVVDVVSQRNIGDNSGISLKVSRGLQTLRAFAIDNYLFALWILVPIVFFSITRSYLTWYTYTSQIALCVLTARLVDYCISGALENESTSRIADMIRKGIAFMIPSVVVVLAFASIISTIVGEINPAGKGGHQVDQFTEDMQGFREIYGEDYVGTNAYLIADFLVDPGNEGHWEPEFVAPAELYVDLIPVDGNLENFLGDPDAILILDKHRWDEFADVLTGHVILYDNSYLIFTNDMY